MSFDWINDPKTLEETRYFTEKDRNGKGGSWYGTRSDQDGLYHVVKHPHLRRIKDMDHYFENIVEQWDVDEYEDIFISGNGYASKWVYLTQEDVYNLMQFNAPWKTRFISDVEHYDLADNDAAVRKHNEMLNELQNKWVDKHPFYAKLREEARRQPAKKIHTEEWPGQDL